MKVFYTKRFKEDIAKPYKKLYLGKYRLRQGGDLWNSWNEGENQTSREQELISEYIESKGFYNTWVSPGKIEGVTDRYYTAEGLEYNGGLQMFFEIPETDQTMYTYYYQVIIFFYQDITNSPDDPNLVYPGFIVFENFGGDTEKTFYGLNLTSRKNIITTPPLPDLRCKLVFEDSLITKELEKPWGNLMWEEKIGSMESLVGPVTKEEEDGTITMTGGKTKDEKKRYISLTSWNNYWLDVVAGEEDYGWMETVYVNKFGIKIY